MKQTAVYSILFSVAALGMIFYVISGSGYSVTAQEEIQQIAAGDTAMQTGGYPGGNVSAAGEVPGAALVFEPGSGGSNYLSIPLPPETKAESVTIENHYMEEEMWIVLREETGDFYETAVISGNRNPIGEGWYEKTESGVVLKFALKDIYEFRSILEDNKIYIEFVAPREMYDKVVVIDPGLGGEENGYEEDGRKEKDTVLAIAAKLKEKLDTTDIKVYYTRMEDSNPSQESRVRIANRTKADMLIRIEANSDNDSSKHGTIAVYNEDYFIPGFGSVELADILETEVVSNIKGKAVGLRAAEEEDYVIRQATVPAAAIQVGYLTNAQEAILLKREDYINKIAEGIYNGIKKVYETALQ